MRLGGYLYFETEADYIKEVNRNPYAGGLIKKPKNFPAYLKYVEGWDAHYCGDWMECKREEVVMTITQKIYDLKQEIHFFEAAKKEIEKAK